MNAQETAEKVRLTFWEKGRFPVDPVFIARKLGVKVLETELPPNVSGALIKEAGKEPNIVIDTNDNDSRKRFTCAHELGHYMDRIESNDEERTYEYIDFRNQASSTGNDPAEIYANRFAACLLMPENAVRQAHRKKLSHFEMAHIFGVSNEAMKFRLKNLNIL